MISYQLNLFSDVTPCSRETFAELLVSDIVVNTCREITRLRELERTASEEERKKLHNEEGRLKRKLPAFLFMASFPNGKRKQTDAVLTGLVMLDFDHVDDPRAQFKQWKEKGFLESLGIMLVHITPSGHGLRVVAKADAQRGNLADNQHYLAQQLGLPLDEACKDASRISFAFPLDYLLYENQEIYNYENNDYNEKFGSFYRGGNSAPVSDDTARASRPGEVGNRQGGEFAGRADERSGGPALVLDTNDEGVPAFHGVTYKTIIEEWWRQNGGVPAVGERNQKLHRLAAHLRYICDNNVDALLQVMPSYGLEPQEMRALCESAVKQKMYGGRPKALAKVLKSVGVSTNEEEEMEEDTADLEAEYRERLNQLVMLPFFKGIMQGVPADVRIGALLASLPMIYTLASRVTFTHFDGVETRLSGMTFIIGPAASGKSFILKLDKFLMEPIRMADKAGRRTEQEYRDSKEMNKNKQKQMEKPHPVIRITPIQISNTMLALRMRDAVDSQDPSLHLHVYSCEAELATALRAQKGGSWIEKNDIYCKSFHNEYWGMDYANDQAINGEIQVNLNLVISGTEDAFDKLIPTNTVLSGLPTRLMYFSMPATHFQMIEKSKKRTSPAVTNLLRDTAYYLDQTRGHVDASKLTDHMYEWCSRLAKRAQIEEDEELDDLRKRTAIIGERAGIAYALVAQRENFEKGLPLKMDKDTLAFAEFVADYCLFEQYRKFAERMQEQKKRVIEVAGNKRRPLRLISVFNSLNVSFTLDELSEARPGKSRNALYATINRMKKRGLIKETSPKHYKKLVTKI